MRHDTGDLGRGRDQFIPSRRTVAHVRRTAGGCPYERVVEDDGFREAEPKICLSAILGSYSPPRSSTGVAGSPLARPAHLPPPHQVL